VTGYRDQSRRDTPLQIEAVAVACSKRLFGLGQSVAVFSEMERDVGHGQLALSGGPVRYLERFRRVFYLCLSMRQTGEDMQHFFALFSVLSAIFAQRLARAFRRFYAPDKGFHEDEVATTDADQQASRDGALHVMVRSLPPDAANAASGGDRGAAVFGGEVQIGFNQR